jgi:hypothetical protein
MTPVTVRYQAEGRAGGDPFGPAYPDAKPNGENWL